MSDFSKSYSLDEVYSVLSKMSFTTWCADWDIKYVNLIVDTRAGNRVYLRDRKGKSIDIQKLKDAIEKEKELFE